MPEVTTGRVAFPLRPGTDDELGRWKSNPHASKFRIPTTPVPELCVAHGLPGMWSRRLALWSRPDTEFDRRSRRSQILHDILFPSERIGRRLERVATGYTTRVRAHGCAECRRWLLLRRSRTVVLSITVLCLFIAVPRTLVVTGYESFSGYSLFAGLILLVITAKSARWIHAFAQASITQDGSQLVISDAHPDYVREALLRGAERHNVAQHKQA